MSAQPLPTIGFICLGIMGKPMARNLLKAGYSLTVSNRSRGSVDELVADGANAGTTPRDVAVRSDVVITMLPDSPDVESVALGDDGIISGIRDGALWIDMSTIAPATTKRVADELAKKGVTSLDAPVSGGEKGAIDAALSIMVGGSDEAFARAKPIFEALGKNIVHVGALGAGQVTKACNQIVVGVTIEAVAEALALAEAAGVDPAKVRAALLGGFAQSKILDVHGQRMIDRTFNPGFKSRLHRKDMNIAANAGDEHGLNLDAAKLVRAHFDELIARGDGERDHSALRLRYHTPAAVSGSS
ncbi:MAG: 2-hydroxy-3-oxopropionate reductase [Candidatus Eremiobacteraeota bacterium]|nr:2-hydroxy-3-oxopropionate reductase [Candidatus Eremiobacteraeota bacterium]